MSDFLNYRAALETGDYITPQQVIKKYGVSRSWIYKEIESGRLPVDRIGRYVLIPLRDLITDDEG